jgi:hypothetical protein
MISLRRFAYRKIYIEIYNMMSSWENGCELRRIAQNKSYIIRKIPAMK